MGPDKKMIPELNKYRFIDTAEEVLSMALEKDTRKITVTIEVTGTVNDFNDDGESFENGLQELRGKFAADVIDIKVC